MIGENVIQALFQRQGWRQPSISGLPVLDSENITSNSGKYFNGAYHPQVTINNIYKTQEDPNISDKNFNAYLKELQLKSIRNVCQRLFPSALILNQTLLSDEDGNRDTYSLESGQFVGVAFRFDKRRNASLKIQQVGFFMNGDDAFKVYLFHSSKKAPLNDWDVTAEDKSETFTDINETLYAFSKDIKGGTYYLGYYTDDVSVKPIDRNSLIRKNCFVDSCFFQVDAVKGELFNTDDVQTTTKEYINADFAIYHDYSQMIINNQEQFDDVIGKSVALEVLRIMYSTTRSNYEDREAESKGAIDKQRIFFDIHGNNSNANYPYLNGIITDIDMEIKRLNALFHKRPKVQINTLR